MKQSPDERRIRQRMAVGALSRDGFLGDDVRSLAEIIDADRRAMESRGLSGEHAAAVLEKVGRTAMEAQGAPVAVGQDLSAVCAEAMGRIACPWGGCGLFAKGEIRLRDLRTGRELLFTPLSVHLIGRHGFHQGRGSRYRVDPGDLADILPRLR